VTHQFRPARRPALAAGQGPARPRTHPHARRPGRRPVRRPAPNPATSKPQATPARFASAASAGDHFRTDPSYLPDLRAYLDKLLQDRERVAAAAKLDDWARAEATPSDQEIDRLRKLIRRVETDFDALTGEEQQQIREAVAMLRRTRTVNIGVPGIRTAEPDLRLEREA